MERRRKLAALLLILILKRRQALSRKRRVRRVRTKPAHKSESSTAAVMKRKSCPYGPTNDYVLSSPIGRLAVKSCPHGLHSLHQMDDEALFTPDLSIEVKLLSQEFEDNGYTYQPVLGCLSWLDAYFKSPCQEQRPLPAICGPTVFPRGSFWASVWRTLSEKIGPGTTVSYGELARLCNNPRASQSVGSAMRNNPLQLLVPCHRVVRHNGTLGHYAGGKRDDVKQWLLNHEGMCY
ncbi:LOW QUALITY PROTEIN: methylated-DNA--protein-cysteine methyltransferase-like [Dermacentor silvarum]|uniref:LOW QUALITY PROTEIN: methylated-DNA--protein-cysteine methyltransferase-like n=1 Tax=Dermacentor silvarum TaxID=543639 RepID=UPI00189A14A8|nr:LOW QUALITY PROTEIN: methylated-DNA--protein-cysteine methyltransferase-like [Dermacentor silvarum]